MPNLSAEQIDELTKALTGALNEVDLDRFVHISTGDRLELYWVAAGKPRFTTIRELLIKLDETGQVAPFLKVVYLNRPHRQDVRDLIKRVCPDAGNETPTSISEYSIQRKGVPDPTIPKNAFAPGLQKNIRPHLHQLDIIKWAEGLLSAKRRACRVEFQGAAAGSGFLVGPQAVLTNWHVVEGAYKAGRMTEIGCRFDYAKRSDGTRSEGVVVAVEHNGIAHSSPYAPAEITPTPDQPPPTPTELDFALLRLAKPIGNETVDEVMRGWISLPKSAMELPIGSPLIIVQHPDGAPIKMAIDTEAILSVPTGSPRIRYATNTEPGSSGSPCFTMDWDLVALHHLGDPAWTAPKFNQGIPAWLIRADIEAAGWSHLICEAT